MDSCALYERFTEGSLKTERAGNGKGLDILAEHRPFLRSHKWNELNRDSIIVALLIGVFCSNIIAIAECIADTFSVATGICSTTISAASI